MADINLKPKLNHIYYGDCAGEKVFDDLVGTKKIHHVTLTAVDWLDERTAAGLVGKTASGALIGGVVAGPLGQLVGAGLAARNWNKKVKRIYHVELEFGEGLKGKAWIDESAVTYLKKCAE